MYTGWLVLNLVGTSEDMFSHNMAQLFNTLQANLALSLGSIETDLVISELCYNEVTSNI